MKTFNYRTENGPYTQQVTQQGNRYTVKTWVGEKRELIAESDDLTRREKDEQLDYQSEYAELLLERVGDYESGLASGKYGF